MFLGWSKLKHADHAGLAKFFFCISSDLYPWNPIDLSYSFVHPRLSTHVMSRLAIGIAVLLNAAAMTVEVEAELQLGRCCGCDLLCD